MQLGLCAAHAPFGCPEAARLNLAENGLDAATAQASGYRKLNFYELLLYFATIIFFVFSY